MERWHRLAIVVFKLVVQAKRAAGRMDEASQLLDGMRQQFNQHPQRESQAKHSAQSEKQFTFEEGQQIDPKVMAGGLEVDIGNHVEQVQKERNKDTPTLASI